MKLKLQTSKTRLSSKKNIIISGSKSESNRLLILQKLFPSDIILKNLSNSEDTLLLQKALNFNAENIDIHHAGTAMRFLTAYYAIQENQEVTLTGSSRMKERPIKILVDALKSLGADITYLENNGFPPLKIRGKNIIKNTVSLNANVSSQYISALLLIAPKLKNGLKITLAQDITSRPYLDMTVSLLKDIGVNVNSIENTIEVKPLNTIIQPKTFFIESDWSSASYFYSIIALSNIGTSITLSFYKKDSLQGDLTIVKIYEDFGVKTIFEGSSIQIIKISTAYHLKPKTYHLINTPDIAQTIAVTCFGLGISCLLTGLHTLVIKETNRLSALKTELKKLGAQINITQDSIQVNGKFLPNNCSTEEIDTYNDHRMAMAFAPLCLINPIVINESEVVTKSYPNFWEDLRILGIQTEEK